VERINYDGDPVNIGSVGKDSSTMYKFMARRKAINITKFKFCEHSPKWPL